jgi:23S rRNA (pseudouridine1915-N3)-methyltransferase
MTSEIQRIGARISYQSRRPTLGKRKLARHYIVRAVKLVVLAVGKLRDAWVQEGCEEYARRLRPKLPLELVELKDDDELVRRLSKTRGRVWALDERGKQLSSEELARKLQELMNSGEAGVSFLIGGADGLPQPLVAKADFHWSLGRLTLPHRLARLILLEQLYRAMSILRGEPYHRA